MEYVAFAVGVGGLDRGRPRIRKLLRDWNARLAAKGVGLFLRQGFGHTGNFLLTSEQERGLAEIADLLSEILKTKFAVFYVPEFLGWLGKIQAAVDKPPVLPPTRRATPGAVMAVNTKCRLPPLPAQREWVAFASVACPRVRGVWKLDILNPNGKTLDRKRREGTWGRIASLMKGLDGTTWTARSLKTLNGLAKRLSSMGQIPKGIPR